MRRSTFAPAAVVAAVMTVAGTAQIARAAWIPTNLGVGADAEVRESSPTQNRGSSTELASRVRNDSISGAPNDGSDRNSAIYTKFDLTGVAPPANLETAFRMSYRNNNLTGIRIQDTVTPNPAIRTGLAIYGLSQGLNWDEATITYLNAPGITLDGDVGTKDFNDDLTFLGTVAFPEIGAQNHLPIGGFLEFRSDALDGFVGAALANGESTVTLVSTVIHDGDTPFALWRNFNYLFNPKEQTTLNSDNYDPDGLGDIGNAYGVDNSGGAFSPQLLVASVPEPASVLLLAASGIALASRHNRRRCD